MKIGSFDLKKDVIFIIAEVSYNYNGVLQNAINSI
jgi:sialic acid synthase SpsE